MVCGNGKRLAQSGDVGESHGAGRAEPYIGGEGPSLEVAKTGANCLTVDGQARTVGLEAIPPGA